MVHDLKGLSDKEGFPNQSDGWIYYPNHIVQNPTGYWQYIDEAGFLSNVYLTKEEAEQGLQNYCRFVLGED